MNIVYRFTDWLHSIFFGKVESDGIPVLTAAITESEMMKVMQRARMRARRRGSKRRSFDKWLDSWFPAAVLRVFKKHLQRIGRKPS